MKNRYFLWTFSALTVLVGFTACKKDSSGTPSNSSTATISGKAFKSSLVTGFDDTNGKVFNLYFAQVSGNDSIVLSLSLPDTAVVNKPYDLGGELAYLDYMNYGTQEYYTTSFYMAAGTVTITALNKDAHNIQGNYSTSVWKTDTDSLIIKDGKFNVNYTAQ